jgi:hypothetical protein
VARSSQVHWLDETTAHNSEDERVEPARISTTAPAGKPSLCAGTSAHPFARVIAASGQWPEASGSTPSATRRNGTTSVIPIVDTIFRKSVIGIATASNSAFVPDRTSIFQEPERSMAAMAVLTVA